MAASSPQTFSDGEKQILEAGLKAYADSLSRQKEKHKGNQLLEPVYAQLIASTETLQRKIAQ